VDTLAQVVSEIILFVLTLASFVVVIAIRFIVECRTRGGGEPSHHRGGADTPGARYT
jgi:hypothetical protein